MSRFFVLCFLLYGFAVQAQPVAVFCGGEMYENIEENLSLMKLSGFNTVIFWSIHVATNGDLILNHSLIISDGEYVGKENWPSDVMNLKHQPTSVNRIEFSVGAWSVPDFENIEDLILQQGVGENSILYRNFRKLKEVTGADAIDFDDESNYDVNSTVQFSKMLVNLGYNISLCPYTQKNFWKSVYERVKAEHPNAIDVIYLQCYAGGSYNTPSLWNDLFDGIQVSPGLWCSHGTNCASGYDYRSVKQKLLSWRSGIEGGFMWSFDGILACTNYGTPRDYAEAIREVMNMKTLLPGKAIQPVPVDSAFELSVDVDLFWTPGSWDAKHRIYLGTDSVLSENNFLRTTGKSEFDPGTLKNNSTYYWRVDEGNNAGIVEGDIWQFRTEKVTILPEKAYAPKPADGDENPGIWSPLSWSAGKGTVEHNVYFGTTNPPPFIQKQSDTIYQPDRLLTRTYYYWRIDESNSAGVTEGEVWSFSILNGNIAPEANVTVSSEYADPNWNKDKLTDGIVKIDGTGEWASDFETYPWVKLNWDTIRTIDRIVLYDRPHSSVAIYAGTLTFSDGSSIKVGELPNDGDPLEVKFTPRNVSWLKFQVDDSPGSTTGLSEIEVYETTATKINRVEKNNFLIYPNPSSNGVFSCKLPSNGAFQLTVYNTHGVIVKKTYQYNEDKLDLGDLPGGLYLVRLLNKTEEYFAKVIRR